MFDVDVETVETLRKGDQPTQVLPAWSNCWPVACWREEDVGAVLFLRRWRSNRVEFDCAIARKRRGYWEQPSEWIGGPWLDDLNRRSGPAWGDQPVLWIRAVTRALTLPDSSSARAHLVIGAAASEVGGFEVHSGARVRRYTVGLGGAFVLGAVDEEIVVTAIARPGAQLLPRARASLRVPIRSNEVKPNEMPVRRRAHSRESEGIRILPRR